jgi:hypothetical protein
MAANDRELAKEIIVEIVRQAGGTLDLKTAIFKAFYHAHVRFADTQPGYLSMWPIVRMPNGPGIHRFDRLVLQLVAEKRLAITTFECGHHRAYRFTLGEKVPCSADLPEGAFEAIAYGVGQVIGKTASQISHESHLMSRAWRDANDGDELNVYLDSLNEADYTECTTRAAEIGKAIDSAWN